MIRAVGVETGGSNVQFAVNPAHRRDRRHRDEPARLALERAGEQGDRVPDRQDRRPAGRRLHAAGDPQRHHARHARELRARDRLLRGQMAAVRVREVPRRRGRPDHAHEVRRRGDGDRTDVQAGVRQGDALARARRQAELARRTTRSCSRWSRQPGRRALRPRRSRRCAAAISIDELHRRTSIDPWFLQRAGRAGRTIREAPFAGERTFKSVDTCAAEFAARTPYYYSGWERRGRRAAARGSPRRNAKRRDPRLGPEPDRPGDRVRLLLRARRPDGARDWGATRS